jgi:hypothetical protein
MTWNFLAISTAYGRTFKIDMRSTAQTIETHASPPHLSFVVVFGAVFSGTVLFGSTTFGWRGIVATGHLHASQ